MVDSVGARGARVLSAARARCYEQCDCIVNTPPRSYSRGLGAESVPVVPVTLRAERSGVGMRPSSIGRMHDWNATRASGFVSTSGIMLVVETHCSMS